MAREFFRSDRVGAQLQRELAELIRTEVRDPSLGMITLSDLEVTRDMSLARAYVSFLGAEKSPQACIKQLNLSVPLLRKALSGRIRLRVMPELRFIHDESIERGMKMEALLSSLAENSPVTDDGPPDQAA